MNKPRVKIFFARSPLALQDEINDWLKAADVKVINISLAESGKSNYFYIAVCYETE